MRDIKNNCDIQKNERISVYYLNIKSFEGVVNNLERKYLETDSDWKREEISQFQNETECERCKGMRLKEEADLILNSLT